MIVRQVIGNLAVVELTDEEVKKYNFKGKFLVLELKRKNEPTSVANPYSGKSYHTLEEAYQAAKRGVGGDMLALKEDYQTDKDEELEI